MKYLRYLSIAVIALLCFTWGRSCQGPTTIEKPVIIHQRDTLSMPADTVIRWLSHWAEAKPETIVLHDTILVLPAERIISVNWRQGRLQFLTDKAAEYVYNMPTTTYMFSVRAKREGWFVKYRTQWWDPRLMVGASYPWDAFARFDLTLKRRLFLQGEATTGGWKVGVGWRIF